MNTETKTIETDTLKEVVWNLVSAENGRDVARAIVLLLKLVGVPREHHSQSLEILQAAIIKSDL